MLVDCKFVHVIGHCKYTDGNVLLSMCQKDFTNLVFETVNIL